MKILNLSDLEKAKREINKSKEKPIIVQAKNDVFNRKTEQKQKTVRVRNFCIGLTPFPRGIIMPRHLIF